MHAACLCRLTRDGHSPAACRVTAADHKTTCGHAARFKEKEYIRLLDKTGYCRFDHEYLGILGDHWERLTPTQPGRNLPVPINPEVRCNNAD
jgi:hypothetical protein